jgi:hypothetical protein
MGNGIRGNDNEDGEIETLYQWHRQCDTDFLFTAKCCIATYDIFGVAVKRRVGQEFFHGKHNSNQSDEMYPDD